MAVNLSPVGGVAAQFFDNSGNPLSGGKLYSYAAGTTTPQTTYTSSNGSTAHSNPIVLDAAGRVPAGGEIWLTDGINYKFVLKTSTDTLIATYDNITGINSNSVSFTNQQEIATATAGQTVFNLGITYQPGTNSLSVFVDGVNQYGPGAQYAYVETDENTVTFNNGLHVGALVKFTTSQQQGAGSVDASQVAYTAPFTGATATNVEAKLAQIVSPKDFGAVGNGVTNDQAALQLAINSGQLVIDLAGATYAVVTKLIFSQAGQTIQNGTLLFDGDNTERLANITANNVSFSNVIFHGNEKQPRSALVWVADNVQHPSFVNCTFKKLTGRYWGTSVLNAMYAVLISPYGVLNFAFRDCLFQDLIKYNDGANTIPVTPAFVGGGFVGGVCFLPENLNPGAVPQTVITQGTIEGCTFDNIQTIRAAGLTVPDQIEFNDADAIRTYGDANTPELRVHVSDCVFKSVSKRCFKFRASGSVAHDNECYAADLPYPMTSPIDLTSNTKVINLKVYASTSKPVYNAITWSQGPDYNREALVEGLFVSHATNGMNFFSDPAFGVMRNFTLRNSFFNQVYYSGIISSAPVATSYENIVVDNVQFWGGDTTTIGIQVFGGSSTNSAGFTLKNSYLSNCNINCTGSDINISNVTVDVTSSSWVGASNTTRLVRVGDSSAVNQFVDNLVINATNLNTGFVTVNREVVLLLGSAGAFRNMTLRVPQALSQAYPHVNLYGSNLVLDGFVYDGPSFVYVGTTAASSDLTVLNAVRTRSGGSATTQPFLYTSNAGTTRVTFQNIVDFRDPGGSTPSVQVNGGTNIAVIGLVSAAAATEVASSGAVVATFGCSKFSTPTQAYSLSNVTTSRTLDASTITTSQLASVVGTLLNDLRDRMVVRM